MRSADSSTSPFAREISILLSRYLTSTPRVTDNPQASFPSEGEHPSQAQSSLQAAPRLQSLLSGGSSEMDEAIRNQARKVIRALARDYPDAECALLHENPLQLLIATILSAQCTDQRVNLVTPALFAKYPTAKSFAKAPIPQLEKAVHSTGFYRNKAKNIKSCCQQLVECHGGEVPQKMEELVALPGVGRKTASVVLGTFFGIAEGVVVDTHVGRISRRLGLTSRKDAVQIERDLMKCLPKKQWILYSHRMIHHGRQVCKARKPLCDDCGMRRFCPRIEVST